MDDLDPYDYITMISISTPNASTSVTAMPSTVATARSLCGAENDGEDGGWMPSLQMLGKDGILDVVNMLAEFTVGSGSTANWIQFTATGGKLHCCCNYGDHVPAVWFYANTRHLHIHDGQAFNSYDGWIASEH